MCKLLGPGAEVRVLSVFRRNFQRHLLTAAGDPERNPACLQWFRGNNRSIHLIVLTGEADPAVAPGIAHDLYAFIEAGQSHSGGGESVSVSAPLVFVPTAADAHLQPAARDDVGGGRNLRQIRRVAVAHGRAHLADLDPRCRGRICRHQGPGLMGGLVARHRHSVEVVVDPQRIPRPAVCVGREVAHDLPVFFAPDADQVHSPALRDEQSEFHARNSTVGPTTPGAACAGSRLSRPPPHRRMPRSRNAPHGLRGRRGRG